MRVRAVWRFFEAEASGNDVVLFEPGGQSPVHHLAFGRQGGGQSLCLADFVSEDRGRDSVAFFVVSAGEGVRRRAEEAKVIGEYLKSHALQALALETAEAAAEFVHARLRSLWGFEDPLELQLKDLLTGRYRGKRFSPGYPAWPSMEDQRILFDLLRPEEIGVDLTEGMMMAPEASVSAMVLHHPEARYFSLV
jgi:5-methyltetrahydrofolate--homocysteine methyltransferase